MPRSALFLIVLLLLLVGGAFFLSSHAHQVPLTKIDLPKYTPGCDTDLQKIACDYPNYNLNKIMSTKLANSGSPAAALIKNFHWTNADQNLVAKYITADKMTPEAAAKKWISANPAKVNAWLGK